MNSRTALFVPLMALREFRASWRRLLFFFICVAIGVGAIVALRSLIQTVRTELAHEARALIAADVSIRGDRPWTPDVRGQIERRLAAAPVIARQEMIETATMVRPEQGRGAAVARIVELRGVEVAYPFYGTVTLADGRPFSHDLLANRGVLVRPELLAQLGLSVGDRLVIGGQPFTIRGVIAQEPGRRVGAFSLGSRALVDLADLKQTGLLSFGSRAGYYVLLKMPPQAVGALVKQLRDDFRDRYVSVWSYQSTEDQIGEDLQRAENHLSLVGFVILILGGIGVWSVTRVFVRQQIRSVAILKCVGATTGQVLAAYLLQVVLLGCAGSAFGILLARIGLSALPPSFAAALGIDGYHLTASAVAQGVGVGLLVSLLFSLVPLLEVRRVKPLLLLRATAPARHLDWLQIGVGGAVAGSLVAIASWQAASLKLGAIVCGGFAGIGLVLYVLGTAIVHAITPLAAARAFPLRHAVLSLARPGNQTRVILLAVGLGSFFVVGVRSVQSTLIQEFSLEVSTSGADMFLIDILPAELQDVRQFLAARKAPDAPPPRLIPVLRARVTGVRGRDTNLSSFEDVRRQGAMGREFVITYRDHLEPNEQVAAGTFWTGQAPLAEDARPAEVSVEQGLMQRAHLRLGDILRFDVLGRIVEARVTSVRDVQWRDARNGGFMFIFRPGTFDHAPQTYIGILQAPADPSDRGRFQRDLATRFPNVSAIDVREVFTTIATAIRTVTLAISIVGGVALLSGILILIGAVAMTKFQRVYEAAILRTLGASTRMLGTMLALEYGGLGLLSGVIGGAGAIALSWAVARYVLDITWHPAPGIAAAGALATTALVGIVGVIASYDVLRKKPLGTLRAE